MTELELIELARQARLQSYSPYSGFSVGAALLCADGTVYQGCNIENASFGATNCAERTAFFKAIYDGKRDFSAIAVVGGPTGKPMTDYASPCGICRQVMREFCKDDFRVIFGKDGEEHLVMTLAEVLPASFSAQNLEG